MEYRTNRIKQYLKPNLVFEVIPATSLGLEIFDQEFKGAVEIKRLMQNQVEPKISVRDTRSGLKHC